MRSHPRTATRPGRRIPALLLVILTAACGREGSEFVGNWVALNDPNEIIVISRNGGQFLLESGREKIGAAYSDGSLEIATALGPRRITYVEASDSLIAPGFFSQTEFVRQGSKAALQAAAERERQQEMDRRRREREREERERVAAARQAERERKRAERAKREELDGLRAIGLEAYNRGAYDDAVPPLLDAARRGHAGAQNDLAWLYATARDSRYLDGEKAVQFAASAVRQKPENWNYLDTAGAAYARAGNFEEAVKHQQRAIDTLRVDSEYSARDRERYLKGLKSRLDLYSRREVFTQ